MRMGSEGKSPFHLPGLSVSFLLAHPSWAEQSESRLALGGGRGIAEPGEVDQLHKSQEITSDIKP